MSKWKSTQRQFGVFSVILSNTSYQATSFLPNEKTPN